MLQSFRKSRRDLFMQEFVLAEEGGDDGTPRAHRVFRIGDRSFEALAASVDFLRIHFPALRGVADDAREELVSALHFGGLWRVVAAEHALMEKNDRLANLRVSLGRRAGQHVRLDFLETAADRSVRG